LPPLTRAARVLINFGQAGLGLVDPGTHFKDSSCTQSYEIVHFFVGVSICFCESLRFE
jgi:hypothetical protein